MMSLGADDKGDLGFVCFSTDFSCGSSDAGQLVSDCQLPRFECREDNLLNDLSVLAFANTISEHENLFRLLVRVFHERLQVGLDHFGHARDDFPVDQ
jgi:hypothetical protein